jgi:hypothetical protein
MNTSYVSDEANTKNEMATFEAWLDSINTILFETHGVEVEDLADEPFMDYYDDGLEPRDVVDIMLESALVF